MADKITKCRCGRRALVLRGPWSDDYRVECERLNCWEGPYRKTKALAIKAWEKVMK